MSDDDDCGMYYSVIQRAEDVLEGASSLCLRMIAGYYGLYVGETHPSQVVMHMRQNHLPLQTVVNAHIDLLRIDAKLRQERDLLDREERDLACQWQLEETRAAFRNMAHHGARLRMYMSFHCPECAGNPARTDFTVLRVWPNSVRVRLSGHPHKPLRERWIYGSVTVSGDNAAVGTEVLAKVHRKLHTFDDAVMSALPLLPTALSDIVIQFVGVSLFVVGNGTVELDFD